MGGVTLTGRHSGQAVLTDVFHSPPRYKHAFISVAHRVQHSFPLLVVFHRILLTRLRLFVVGRSPTAFLPLYQPAQAHRRVLRLRMRLRRGACARAALHIQRACRGLLGRKRAASLKAAANLDIWRAARLGTFCDMQPLFRAMLVPYI